VTHALRRRGMLVNHKRVARFMRVHGLAAKWPRRYVATTDGDHDLPIFRNLTQDFVASAPDQLWVADLTYIQLGSRFVYVAVIIDAWSRKVVGYVIGNTMETRLALAALESACVARHPAPGLIHHSDRGSQYAARAYRQRLADWGIVGSMSRRGNPYDNAKAESFMKTLKYEEVLLVDYLDLEDLQTRLPTFIEERYNRKRLHSSLGYLPPEEFEQRYCARQPVNP